MALGDLVIDETGTVTGIRVLSNDASGSKLDQTTTMGRAVQSVGAVL